MNLFDIHISSECPGSEVIPFETVRIGSPELDLELLGSRYKGQKAALSGSFAQFCKIWESIDCRRSLDPEGCISFITKGSFPALLQAIEKGPLESCFSETLHRSSMAAISVWTLGGKIEEKVTRHKREGSRLTGFIMDAALSLTLNRMYSLIKDMIIDKALSRFGLFPTAGFFPGTGAMGIEVIPQIIRMTCADSLLGMSYDRGMMHPVKSRCSVILLGDAPFAQSLDDLPCDPCPGKRCLYYQIGGCHVSGGGPGT